MTDTVLYGQRSEHALLEGIAQLLEETLAELKHLRVDLRDSRESTSSVEVKFSAATKDLPSKPAPVVKEYDGSRAPVEEAIVDYGRAVLLMEQALVDGWGATVAMLTEDGRH